MTQLFNDPRPSPRTCSPAFSTPTRATSLGVPGGVVRAQETPPGKVAVVVGGGSGHYPAFCGMVGPGFADGAVVGNIFTSPSAEDAYNVGTAAHGDAGVLLQHRQLRRRRDELRPGAVSACAARASTPTTSPSPTTSPVPRRKRTPSAVASPATSPCSSVASAAAEDGYDLDARGDGSPGRQRPRPAPSASRSTGAPCRAQTTRCSPWRPVSMGVGLGIHGEPGVADEPMPRPPTSRTSWSTGCSARSRRTPRNESRSSSTASARTKYEELFVVWKTVSRLLRGARLHGRRPRGRRTGHQPRHGRLLADRDVARRRTRAVLDRTGRHPGLPQGRGGRHAAGGRPALRGVARGFVSAAGPGVGRLPARRRGVARSARGHGAGDPGRGAGTGAHRRRRRGR